MKKIVFYHEEKPSSVAVR